MWPPEAEPLPRDSMLLARAVLPARRFTRSLALGRSSGSFCKQSRTSCASSYVQSSGTLQEDNARVRHYPLGFKLFSLV